MHLISDVIGGCLPGVDTSAIWNWVDIGPMALDARKLVQPIPRWVDVLFRFGQNVRIELFTVKDSACPWKSLLQASKTSGDTGSDEIFMRAVKWVETCTENHPKCGRGRKSALPTRVLDLGRRDGELRLCETKGKSGLYASLSLCWGDEQPIQSTGLNIKSHCESMAWDSLPQVFKDAVLFTRRMGIRYLWFDSLCVIQDDEDDWQRESAKMATIFQNSYLTLAATRASRPTEGCFARCLVKEFTGFWENGARYRIYARKNIVHCSYDGNRTNEYYFPLLERAWVFQERLLPPRVLHFGPQELFWECMEGVECECGDIRQSVPVAEEVSKNAHINAFASPYAQLDEPRWRQMVSEYSGLSLTRPSDRLPALSGATRQMQIHRQDVFHAGLWSLTLCDDLTWYVGEVTFRPDHWSASTWSCASIDVQVQYPRVLTSMEIGRMAPICLFDVLEVVCEPVGLDPLGELSEGASLKVHGHIVFATLAWVDSEATQESI